MSKRQNPMRRRGAGRKALKPKSSVAAGYSYGQLNARANGTIRGDELVLEFTELAMTCVVPPSTAPPQSTQFWPGASGMTRLDTFAQLYSQYRVEAAELEFRPAVGTNVSGIQVTGFAYDGNDIPSSLSTAMGVEPRFSDVPWVGGRVRLPVDRLMKSKWHFTANGSNPSGFNTTGSVFWHASGTNGAILGNIWLKYRVRFSGPTNQVTTMNVASSTFPAPGSSYGLGQAVASDLASAVVNATLPTNWTGEQTNGSIDLTRGGVSSSLASIFLKPAGPLIASLGSNINPNQLVEFIAEFMGITTAPATGPISTTWLPNGANPNTGENTIQDSMPYEIFVDGSIKVCYRIVDYLANMVSAQLTIVAPGSTNSWLAGTLFNVGTWIRPFIQISTGNSVLPQLNPVSRAIYQKQRDEKKTRKSREARQWGGPDSDDSDIEVITESLASASLGRRHEPVRQLAASHKPR